MTTTGTPRNQSRSLPTSPRIVRLKIILVTSLLTTISPSVRADCIGYLHQMQGENYWKQAVAIVDGPNEVGTGFLIDNERGLFLTANHVVGTNTGDHPIVARFATGEKFDLKAIVQDDDLDVALLETINPIHVQDRPELELSFRLAGEQSVVILTAAYGTIERPEISSETISKFSAQSVNWFSVDEKMPDGSSGGPVISESHGIVIGIVTQATAGTTSVTRMSKLAEFFANHIPLPKELANIVRGQYLVSSDQWHGVFAARPAKKYRNYEIATAISLMTPMWKVDASQVFPGAIRNCDVFDVITNRRLDVFDVKVAGMLRQDVAEDELPSVAQETRFIAQSGLAHIDPVFVTFHPQEADTLMVLNSSGRIDLLNVRDWNSPFKTAEISTGARAVAFSPDGTQIVSGGFDGMLRLWDATGAAIGQPPTFVLHEGGVVSVAFSPDGRRIVSGDQKGAVRVWRAGAEGLTALGAPSSQLQRHDGAVLSVAFIGNARIVSSGNDGSVLLWEVSEQGLSLKERKKSSEDRMVGVTFSLDGKLAMYERGGVTVQLWDVEKSTAIGKPMTAHEYRYYPNRVLAAFGPDGTRLVTVGRDDGTVRLWAVDKEGLTEIDAQATDAQRMTGIAFNNDGTRIVSSDSNTLRMWDAASGAAIGTPLKTDHGLVAVAYSKDMRRIVSASRDGIVQTWYVDEKRETATQIDKVDIGIESSVSSVAFSTDGERMVSGHYRGILRLWTLDMSGRITNELPLTGHEGYIDSVAFSRDGKLIVSGDSTGNLRLWDAISGTALGTARKGSEQRGYFGASVNSVAFSSDGRLIVSSGSDRTLRLWNVESSGIIPRGLPQDSSAGAVVGVAFSPDDRLLVFGDGNDGTLHLWEVEKWGTTDGEILCCHEGGINSVAFHLDGKRVVSGGDDGTVRLWSVEKLSARGEPLRAARNWVESVAFSSDGTRIVSGALDGTVRLWRVESLNSVGGPLTGQESAISMVLVSRDGKLVARGENGGNNVDLLNVVEWGVDDSTPLMGPEWLVRDLHFSEDASRAVSVDADLFVHLWDMERWDTGESIQLHWDDFVSSAALSRDGKRIILGRTNGTVQLWDVDQGIAIGEQLTVHDGPVVSVTFSEDEKRIASGGDDGTVRLWDLEKDQPMGAPLMRWEDREFRVSSVAFSPDGRRVVAGSFNGPIRMWDVNDERVIASALPCINYDVRWLSNNALLVRCHDRLVYLNADLDFTGEVFLRTDGLVAIARGKGVYASSPELRARVYAFNGQGDRVDLQSISLGTTRRVLFDDWESD